MTELFTEKKWIGEFFVPDQYEKRFSGKIDYSPENGVILYYSITGHDVPSESDVVYGVLDSGEKCTLVGKFIPQNAGISFINGLNTRRGRVVFSFLLIGDFFTHDELFYELDFSLTSLQEFFFPKGYKDLEKYSKKPLFSMKTPYGEIKVGNNASFTFMPEIDSLIYSDNESSLEELKRMFEKHKENNPDSHFMLRKDIAYRISLKIDAGTTISNAYDYISDVANLFAILIYCPVHPESISIYKKVDGEYPLRIEVYPSMMLNRRTIELSTKNRSHFNMPIKKSSVDLPAILGSWINSPKIFSTIVSSMQHETGFRDEHSLHGEILLYITQLEYISHDSGLQNNQKYEYPLNTYGSDKVRAGILKIFKKVGETDMGKGIGDLRNEIVHVRKPKKLLHVLSLRDMVNISQFLHMTIIGYILTILMIKKEVINDYQNKFTPDV